MRERSNIDKFHFNPFQINQKSRKYFNNLQTQRLFDEDDENFLFSNIKEINIPYSIVKIGNDCLKYCQSLTTITISSRLTKIGEISFSHCSKLTAITLPSVLTSLNNGLLQWCNKLTRIEYSPFVVNLNNGLFHVVMIFSIIKQKHKANEVYFFYPIKIVLKNFEFKFFLFMSAQLEVTQELAGKILRSVETLNHKITDGITAYEQFSKIKYDGFNENPSEEEVIAIERAERILKGLEEVIKGNEEPKNKIRDTIGILQTVMSYFNETLENIELENERVMEKRNDVISKIIVLEERKTIGLIQKDRNKKHELKGRFKDIRKLYEHKKTVSQVSVNGSVKEGGCDQKKIMQQQPFQRTKENTLGIERYCGKLSADGKTYEKFQLSNSRYLFVNVWENDGGADRSNFSKIKSHGDDYLINVLFGQAIGSIELLNDWKKTIGLKTKVKEIQPNANENYVVTKHYFKFKNVQNKSVKIPLVLPFPSFLNQNTRHVVFFNFCLPKNKNGFIVFDKPLKEE